MRSLLTKSVISKYLLKFKKDGDFNVLRFSSGEEGIIVQINKSGEFLCSKDSANIKKFEKDVDTVEYILNIKPSRVIFSYSKTKE